MFEHVSDWVWVALGTAYVVAIAFVVLVGIWLVAFVGQGLLGLRARHAARRRQA